MSLFFSFCSSIFTKYKKEEKIREKKILGLPRGTSGKELSSQCRRCKSCGFDPWVRKIPRRRAWQSTPVFLTGESHGRLWSIRSQRVRHDLVTKQQQPTTMDIFTKHIAAENKRYLPWLSSYCFIATLSCTWDSNYVWWKAPGSIRWDLWHQQFLTPIGFGRQSQELV